MERIRRILPTVTAVLLILIVWQIWVSRAGISPNVLPSPIAIGQALVDSWPSLWPAAQVTALESFVGFVLAIACGIALGMAFYVSRTLKSALFPLLYAAQTMPLISIAPLFLIWFGFDISGKIIIVAIFGLFPIAVQTIRGLEAVPRFYTDVALTCGASNAWTLWHVKLRVAARHIFGGIRISAAYTVATAATAEYLGSRSGLGIWLQAAYNSFRTPLVFCATIVIIAMTCVLLATVNASELLLIGPASDDEDPDADQL
ncbi:ABC transporter permease [Bifidobacterium tsurumiense]|uniref:ABC transporter permease n=1 Tax=Bifidobacterium tsurumiense TaxID=356829 RepID=UPI0012B3B7DE|nr:ABC transporter permease [Bifidobacterium tsurumiense]MDY4677818.1 ABC transporter permease [Bifidobacterium tsurumiense]MSS12837.1 ABC transporter permease [Bifidobacterium tsurumiense]